MEIKNTQLKIENMQTALAAKLFNINKNIDKFNIKFSDEYLHNKILNEICMYHHINKIK